MRLLSMAMATLLVAAGTPARAEDTDSCGAGLICANNPGTVLKGLQDAGYKAKLSKDSGGDPMISSSTSGYNYDIFFYGCKDKGNCDSLQFRVSFTQDGANSADLANKWNLDKRFGQAAVDAKGAFIMSYDVTTMGGLSKTNFGDVLDWWQATLGNLRTFFDANPAPKK